MAGVVAALGATASPALATDGFSLQFSGSSNLLAGNPVVLTAIGKNPGWTDYPYATYLDAEVFLPSAVPTCPATQDAAGQLAPSTGGAIVAFDVQVNSDPAGNFSIPVGFTPSGSGPLLVCGYTAGLAGETLATASLTVAVQSAAPPTPAPTTPAPTAPAPTTPAAVRPASVTAPRLTRAGRQLICGTGSWANNPTRFSYRWRVGGHTKPGARGRTLIVAGRLRGHKVQCSVTATNSAGSSTALSKPFSVR
jgi:hypothetical protein